VRFADTTLIDLAAGGTPVDLEFAYTLSAQAKLVLTAHEVYLPKPKLAVEGPGGVQASFDFRGAKNSAASRAEGPNIAEPAERTTSPAPEAPGGADGRLCPYREHALISHQEQVTWDMLLACQGQLRLAPSGQILGLDMDAALRIGAARGSDLALFSELLPAAEAGVVDALCRRVSA
jgi:Phage tail tube protein